LISAGRFLANDRGSSLESPEPTNIMVESLEDLAASPRLPEINVRRIRPKPAVGPKPEAILIQERLA
jgi:hypothetical protein